MIEKSSIFLNEAIQNLGKGGAIRCRTCGIYRLKSIQINQLFVDR